MGYLGTSSPSQAVASRHSSAFEARGAGPAEALECRV